MTEKKERNGGGFKRFLAACAVAFAITLAAFVGLRLSTDAIAIIIGAIVGVVASIPTALLIVALTRRSQERAAAEAYEARMQMKAQPPVVVIAPGGGSATPWFSPFSQPTLPGREQMSAQRQFRIVGQSGSDAELLEPNGAVWE